jgi:hypothetical protein
MKKIMLTWYGITDLRASLGFENTEGPIANALAVESYSDVVVLCYTRADNDSKECIESQKTFAFELDLIRNSGQERDWKTTSQFISKFANTTVAHEHFEAWLKKKAFNLDSGGSISFRSEKLCELNDTEGIYAGAMRAMDWVARESGEKLVSLYLSPGTPVMAFVWALAALNYPELKKRLLASSVIGKEPEAISLPAEWLERHRAKQEVIQDIGSGFDVTFHLFGEQRMPSLLGIRQFESERHVFVNSKEYPAACMRQFIANGKLDELLIDPWDARAVQDKIILYAERLPKNTRIGLNLTGGTKLMFAGALSAARALGAIPFYFDSRNRSVTFFDSLRRETIKPIDSVETFLHLNSDGLELSKKVAIEENGMALILQQSGLKFSKTFMMEVMSPDRQSLTLALWKNRAKISKFYQKLRDYNDIFKPFQEKHDGLIVTLNKEKQAIVQGYGLDLVFNDWPDFAKYLCGGWFEEYVYLQCKPYEDSGVIWDLRLNVKLNLKPKSALGYSNRESEYNELDITFTDGYSLYIVECKAGNVTQEQIMKLQNIVRIYGGIEGRGIVACCFPPHSESAKKKIKDARLTLWSGDLFSDQIRTLMNSITARAKLIETTR